MNMNCNKISTYDQQTINYAQENDAEYGKCSTCKNYSNCNICSDCEDSSEYELDLVHYQKEHSKEISKWIKEYQ